MFASSRISFADEDAALNAPAVEVVRAWAVKQYLTFMQLQEPAPKKLTTAPTGEEKPARIGADSAPITCKTCGHVITHVAAKREAGGRHVHLRLNPSAFAFIFGCFSSAPGCVVHGTPT